MDGGGIKTADESGSGDLEGDGRVDGGPTDDIDSCGRLLRSDSGNVVGGDGDGDEGGEPAAAGRPARA